MEFYKVEIAPDVLANLVLSAETDELGIRAGLQDRVIQAYEGCVYMNFEKNYFSKHGVGKYERIPPKKLPPLFIAYKTDLGKVSGTVLNNIRVRFEKGDPEVIESLQEMAELAEKGKKALLEGDHDVLFDLMNRNFDLRCKMMQISEENMELVQTARDCGVSAKFTGSGGSIIGMYKDDEALTRLVVAMRKIKARVIKPYIV